MARSLGIPTVLGASPQLLKHVTDTMTITVNGTTGEVILEPQEETIAALHTEAAKLEQEQVVLQQQSILPAVTQDGHHVTLLANAATLVEAQTARTWGAAGIGSLRTELLFLGRADLPNEEEQIALYTAIADEFPHMPIVIRTLDIGGDKYLPAFPLPKESNPFLGWRGIRIGLSQPETILLPQLRAMLRAAVYADIRIVLPMIATIAEFRQVRAFMQQAQRELAAEDLPATPNPQLGVMIEIPSAAITADVFAQEADFLSIGSNDLIQYTLACDRTNQRVAALNQPLEPAVLQLIQGIVDAAHRHGRKVSLCGEMASDPLLVPLLVGMGIDELSCTPNALPLVRAALRATVLSESRQLAHQVLAASSLEEVLRIVGIG